ncbi:MAG: LysR family transcriptional regulator [Dehalococcoidia bacterium]|nr:LysR family transcriptional regulator [Dehalococcoidia bacterium]MXY88822.1 LysR family transcriptional regulator [Dehalococcoidia bacterium]MXZ88213.1 LysR family transcriptional regulator [Dehalococcoidia bacterium]MYA51900.1 LysR family transcriptional regulator [Dehalococcoidia bacterium]MYH67413.1 LysR family transcriptional regulator [Dehalococcoidia bacterium]
MPSSEPRQKLWIETGGQLVMSDYRVRLLELVAETGSLAEAASALGLSYRRAWGKVKEIEANLGRPLVRSEVGGAGGGRTLLTPEAEELVTAYRRFQQRVEQDVEGAYDAELRDLLSPP